MPKGDLLFFRYQAVVIGKDGMQEDGSINRAVVRAVLHAVAQKCQKSLTGDRFGDDTAAVHRVRDLQDRAGKEGLSGLQILDSDPCSAFMQLRVTWVLRKDGEGGGLGGVSHALTRSERSERRG